jgi:DNA topoisomerase IB
VASLHLPRQERVEHNVRITDKRLARIIQRCQDLPGTEIFQYLDAAGKTHTIASDDVNAHLREITGRDITAKDFRTWGGTCTPRWRCARSARRQAARGRPQHHRGHRPRSPPARQHARGLPQVLRASRAPRGLPRRAHRAGCPMPCRASAQAPRAAALRRDEVAVLQFLQDELAT